MGDEAVPLSALLAAALPAPREVSPRAPNAPQPQSTGSAAWLALRLPPESALRPVG